MSKVFAFFTGLKGYAIAIGAAILALAAAYWRIREDGKNSVRAEQEKHRLESIKQRKETDDEIAQLGTADVDSRYNKWLRDNQR